MNNKSRHFERGFTIIELMIATAVFSLVLLVVMGGILQITRMYYQGVTQTRTQEIARQVVDEIAESIRFSSASINLTNSFTTRPKILPNTDHTGHFCIGSKRFDYAIDRQLKENPSADTVDKQKRNVLWASIADCSVAIDLDAEDPCNSGVACQNGRELLAENMRLGRLELSTVNGNLNVVRVSISVVNGDEDLLFVNDNGTQSDETDDFLTCEGARIGAEFCAVSNISVIVERRLKL